MHPAFSVIFLTTLIGAGQGLFARARTPVQALGLGAGGARRVLLRSGAALALFFLAAGLVASFFHLGRPERAWRAAAMWRTSWLSREVIVLPAFMACVSLTAWVTRSAGRRPDIGTLALGAFGLVLCVALFVCTGDDLRVHQLPAGMGDSPLTVVNYVLLGCASGLTLAPASRRSPSRRSSRGSQRGRPASRRRRSPRAPRASCATRGSSRSRRCRPRIGVKHPRIVQKSQGFMGGLVQHARVLPRRIGGVRALDQVGVPGGRFPGAAALLAAGLAWQAPALLAAAFVVQYAGLLAERWFFFAQANHPQNLYYQRIS